MRFHRKIKEDFTFFTLSDIISQMEAPDMDVSKFAFILDKATSRIDNKTQIQIPEFDQMLTHFDKWRAKVTDPLDLLYFAKFVGWCNLHDV